MSTLNGRGGASHRDSVSSLPTPEQELLLRAALLGGDAAMDAFRDWRARTDFNAIDSGSIRLLPLLYRALLRYGISDSLLPKLRGIHRQTWYKNHIIFDNIAALLRAFHDAGITTLLLKGPALVLQYYKDYGLRPMDDFDVLVHLQDAPEAMQTLQKFGWKPKLKKLPSPQALIPLRHCSEYEDAIGQQFDLHWHVLQECLQSDADDDFWAGAVPTTLSEVSTLTLNPTDQLFHVCVHGMRWNPVPPVRWAADAWIILNTPDVKIDWNRLSAQAEKRRLILPLRDALAYLRDRLDAPIPRDALTSLQALRVTSREYSEYAARTHPQKILGYLPAVWFDYTRATKGRALPLKFLGFARFLQYTWDVEHLWQVPLMALSRCARRLTSTARRRYTVTPK